MADKDELIRSAKIDAVQAAANAKQLCIGNALQKFQSATDKLRQADVDIQELAAKDSFWDGLLKFFLG